MNKNWTKEQTEEQICSELANEYSQYDLTVFAKSDDGGRHLEVRVAEKYSSKAFRKEIPINYSGWRVVVIDNSSTT